MNGPGEALQLRLSTRRLAATMVGAAHGLLVVVGSMVAIVWEQYSALVFAAPSLIVIVAALRGERAVDPHIELRTDRARVIEGDVVVLQAVLSSATPIPLVNLELQVYPHIQGVGPLRRLVSVPATTPTPIDFELVLNDWGVVSIGGLHLRSSDRFGLMVVETHYEIVTPIRVHIHEEEARSLLEPDRFRRLVGSHLSNERGDGCEIADVRPYQAGDELRSLNWRITARNDEPWITLRHPDRSTTLVVVLDALQRADGSGVESLRRSVRATLGLLRLHEGAQDPVGVLVVDHGLRWLEPGVGRAHLHLLTDALLDVSRSTGSTTLPLNRQTVFHLVPTGATIVAISPLIDPRIHDTVLWLRSRGQPVQVIEPVTDWSRELPPPTKNGRQSRDLALRLHRLEQHAIRREFGRSGVPVIAWEENQPVDSVLLALRVQQRARRIEPAP